MSAGLPYSALIPDYRFTASYTSYKPSNARLVTSSQSWVFPPNLKDQWLQIDLGSIVFVCAVATQGRADYNQYVTRYKLSFSFDNFVWQDYQEQRSVKVC